MCEGNPSPLFLCLTALPFNTPPPHPSDPTPTHHRQTQDNFLRKFKWWFDNGQMAVCLFGATKPKLCVWAVGREEPHVCDASSLNGRALRPPGSPATLTRASWHCWSGCWYISSLCGWRGAHKGRQRLGLVNERERTGGHSWPCRRDGLPRPPVV